MVVSDLVIDSRPCEEEEIYPIYYDAVAEEFDGAVAVYDDFDYADGNIFTAVPFSIQHWR